MPACTNCGSDVQSGARFCATCGQPLAETPLSVFHDRGVPLSTVRLACPQCNAQFNQQIDVLDAIHVAECPYCKTGFESLLVTIIAKTSIGNQQNNSRQFSVRVIDPYDEEALVEFSRPSYLDIELRSGDDVILSYLKERLVVVQNLTISRYYRLIPLQQKKKKPRLKRSQVWRAVAIISALPLILITTVLVLPNSPISYRARPPAANPPNLAPTAAATLPPMPTEGRLWCPGCASEGLKIILWEHGSAITPGVMVGEGNHGDEVEILERKHNPSESNVYYLVRVRASSVQGWVPEMLINLDPVSGGPATSEGAVKYYVVQAGDTLAVIAQKYGTTIQRLAELNEIQNTNLIEVGQVLIVEVSTD